MSQTFYGSRRIKYSWAVALSVVLFGATACQQSNRFMYDARYGYPDGVSAEDIEYYESFRMPKMTAGTTPPDHWSDARSMSDSRQMHASNCPCCSSGPIEPYVSAESAVPSGMPQNPATLQYGDTTSTQQSYFLNESGQTQFPASQVLPPTNVPNGKFSANGFERQNFRDTGTIIRAQSPESDEEDDLWGFDADFGDDAETTNDDADLDFDSDAGFDSDVTSTVTAPATPRVIAEQPLTDKAKEGEEKQRRQKEAALKARPTAGDDDIQITFNRREKQDVVIDPALKKAGERIIDNPQVYGEFRNPGGFSFRGQYGAWPQDEYLVDGGDDRTRAFVRNNWEIRGLDPEDTIAHYDTLDDRRLVEKSNRVHIYSPRFGSVRKIDGAVAAIEWQHYAGVQNRYMAANAQSRTKIGRTEQNETADYARSQVILRSANAGANTGTVGVRKSPVIYQNLEVTASLSQLLTHSVFSGAELAYLAEAKRQAVAWGGLDRVEVRVNEQTAQAMIGQKTPEAVFILGEPEKTSKLQLFKVASKETAQRGEIVEFMIRFDNVGSEIVGNVTIADSLTTRLEYIVDSAGSSVPAEFFVEPNEAGSQILRWEITEPLKAGDFGVVRFRCRVQ